MSKEELMAKAKLYLVLHGNDYESLIKMCSGVCKHVKECDNFKVLYPTNGFGMFCIKWLDDD